jgi:hypothetical protein
VQDQAENGVSGTQCRPENYNLPPENGFLCCLTLVSNSVKSPEVQQARLESSEYSALEGGPVRWRTSGITSSGDSDCLREFSHRPVNG